MKLRDGTLIFGIVSGVKERFPKVIGEIHGSQLTLGEYAPEVIVRCLNERKPLQA